MDKKSMTALVSAFARWYHVNQNDVKIFNDSLAGSILSDDEKQQIGLNMATGIRFFNPQFSGTEEEALRWIVDNQLSPSPLGRSTWAEGSLKTAVMNGARQYIIVAAGYDSFAYRQPGWASKLQIFELDYPAMSEDKQNRVRQFLSAPPPNVTYVPLDLALDKLSEKLLSQDTYNRTEISFYCFLGITYYLSKDSFKRILLEIADITPKDSTVAFDYPDEFTYTEYAGDRTKKQVKLAESAGEPMLASYSYNEIEQLLSNCGFLIYEHLMPDEITKQYFDGYNKANPQHPITAFDNVNYCLAVRK